MAVDDETRETRRRAGNSARDACGRAVTISEMRALREHRRRTSRRHALAARAARPGRHGPNASSRH
ncbi:hypothetical protein CO709_05320 [Burkholderia thailandensis]|nr:hypothetical protein CO709_05320 [Burkholderia thailandensis]